MSQLIFRFRYIWLLAFTVLFSACGETKFVDVSAQPIYRGTVGATYTVIGPVSIYGIRKHSKAPIDFVSVIPPPGIEGPEVGFRVPIPIGSTLTVLRIYESNRTFDPPVTFEVKLTGVEIPLHLPIRVDLMRGNEGAEKLSLNAAIFRRI